jgi:alpha-galactosidase
MRSRRFLLILSTVILLLSGALGSASTTPAYASDTARDLTRDDGLARTPPMGWNAWQRFQCDVSTKMIKEQVDALVTTGLASVGFRYVIIDDCWQRGDRDNDGRLQSDQKRFPEGMKFIGDYIHSKGLKFGLYSSRGPTTCAARLGSQNFEELDARTFAAWGVDLVKYDNCPLIGDENEIRHRYQLMAEALKKTGRPIIFSMSTFAFREWMPGTGHMGRTYGDISDDWGAMLRNFDENAGYARYQRPGYWNDPDMLEIGNGKMTPTEYKTMFSLWAISGAPLILSNDVAKLDRQYLNILKNTAVIAVDQDSAGVQGVKIAEPASGLQIWSKRLARNGEWALVLLNRTGADANITVNWKDVDPSINRAAVTDLWDGRGGTYTNSYTSKVIPHGVAMIRIRRAG